MAIHVKLVERLLTNWLRIERVVRGIILEQR